MWSTYNNIIQHCYRAETACCLQPRCFFVWLKLSLIHFTTLVRWTEMMSKYVFLHILLAANVFFSLIPWFRGTVPDYLHCCLWWLQVCMVAMVAMEASLGWPNDSRQTAKKCNEISWIQSSLLRPSSYRAPRPCVMSSSSQWRPSQGRNLANIGTDAATGAAVTSKVWHRGGMIHVLGGDGDGETGDHTSSHLPAVSLAAAQTLLSVSRSGTLPSLLSCLASI